MEPLKRVAALIGWLSGSLAGVTAMLYGLGFIATLTHQRLMGLDWAFIQRDTLWYLGLGGMVAARLFLIGLIWLLLLILAAEILRWALARLATLDEGGWRRLGAVARWLCDRAVWFPTLGAIVALQWAMDGLLPALAARDLLLSEPKALCESGGIAVDLLARSDAVVSRGDEVLGGVCLALGFSWYAARLLLKAEHPPLLAGFVTVAVTVQALGAIPVGHGLFAMSTDLPDIAAEKDGAPVLAPGARLVALAGDGLWVWSPDGRAIEWVARSSYDRLAIGPETPLRAEPCAGVE